MSKTKHSKHFKLDAVQYHRKNPGFSQIEHDAKNPSIGINTLSQWEG